LKTQKKIRVKSTLGAWEDVDRELDRIGELTRARGSITDRYDAEIEKLKTRCRDEQSIILLELENRSQQIYLYAIEHLQPLEVRSKTLTHGVIGFHRSTELKLPKDLEDVIKKLKELGKGACIKITEKVKKLVLKDESEEVIEAVGGKLIPKDNFRIELPETVYEYDKKLRVVRAEDEE